jgi:hypothetical protein
MRVPAWPLTVPPMARFLVVARVLVVVVGLSCAGCALRARGDTTATLSPSRHAASPPLWPGVVLDSEYELAEEPGPVTVVRVAKVAVGPISDEEAAGIATFGDIRSCTPAIETLAAG